jgi:hypothetical protein
MGVYSEYLEKKIDWPALIRERKKQLSRISKLRADRPVLVFAAALTKQRAPIGIDYDDRVPFLDQLGNLEGESIDIILETPGGSAEIVEDLVEQIRHRFSQVAVLVPGYAKSAGTIMVMAADDILMEPASALGPIDAQIVQAGKRYSAHAFIQGLEKIKDEADKANRLNHAYVPILVNISPGEIQSCENLLEFSKKLVAEWLSEFNLKSWKTHGATGASVTDEDRKKRAVQIAEKLCDQSQWLTHGRSIRMNHLRDDLGLQVIDYTQQADLCDAVRRYYTLLKMSFDSTAIYKVYETPVSQIYRFESPMVPPPAAKSPSRAIIDFECPNCHTVTKIQASFKKGIAKEKGAIRFPKDDAFVCPSCSARIDLSTVRRTLESQAKKRVI